MGDIQLSITRAEHDTAVYSAIADAKGTNSHAVDCDNSMDAAAITSMRGGKPTTAVVPSKGTASRASTAKFAAKPRNHKPSANPRNVVAVHPDFDKRH